MAGQGRGRLLEEGEREKRKRGESGGRKGKLVWVAIEWGCGCFPRSFWTNIVVIFLSSLFFFLFLFFFSGRLCVSLFFFCFFFFYFIFFFRLLLFVVSSIIQRPARSSFYSGGPTTMNGWYGFFFFAMVTRNLTTTYVWPACPDEDRSRFPLPTHCSRAVRKKEKK